MELAGSCATLGCGVTIGASTDEHGILRRDEQVSRSAGGAQAGGMSDLGVFLLGVRVVLGAVGGGSLGRGLAQDPYGGETVRIDR